MQTILNYIMFYNTHADFSDEPGFIADRYGPPQALGICLAESEAFRLRRGNRVEENVAQQI